MKKTQNVSKPSILSPQARAS